jgi:hypothetical protein
MGTSSLSSYWCLAISEIDPSLSAGAIGVAVIATLAAPATGGTSIVADAFVTPIAVSILGGPTTLAAISIAVAAGALNKLRKYKIIKKTNNRIILKRG